MFEASPSSHHEANTKLVGLRCSKFDQDPVGNFELKSASAGFGIPECFFRVVAPALELLNLSRRTIQVPDWPRMDDFPLSRRLSDHWHCEQERIR